LLRFVFENMKYPNCWTSCNKILYQK